MKNIVSISKDHISITGAKNVSEEKLEEYIKKVNDEMSVKFHKEVGSTWLIDWDNKKLIAI
jgi:heptaprenylglyceryl phosphate synthase